MNWTQTDLSKMIADADKDQKASKQIMYDEFNKLKNVLPSLYNTQFDYTPVLIFENIRECEGVQNSVKNCIVAKDGSNPFPLSGKLVGIPLSFYYPDKTTGFRKMVTPVSIMILQSRGNRWSLKGLPSSPSKVLFPASGDPETWFSDENSEKQWKDVIMPQYNVFSNALRTWMDDVTNCRWLRSISERLITNPSLDVEYLPSKYFINGGQSFADLDGFIKDIEDRKLCQKKNSNELKQCTWDDLMDIDSGSSGSGSGGSGGTGTNDNGGSSSGNETAQEWLNRIEYLWNRYTGIWMFLIAVLVYKIIEKKK